MSRIRRASAQTDASQIMNEGSTYRGVIKNYARDVVLSCYDLRLGTSEEATIRHTKEKVAALTENFGWLAVSLFFYGDDD